MSKNTKRALLIFILLGVIAAGVGYYAYNKGPRDILNSTGIKATAGELYTLYDTDSTAAQKKYSGQIVEVTGVVKEISENQQKEKIVLLQTSAEGASINCTMEGVAGNIKRDDTVVVKGLCSGIGQGEPDLGLKGDVYLARCFILK